MEDLLEVLAVEPFFLTIPLGVLDYIAKTKASTHACINDYFSSLKLVLAVVGSVSCIYIL